jgi:hypothetical protein
VKCHLTLECDNSHIWLKYHGNYIGMVLPCTLVAFGIELRPGEELPVKIEFGEEDIDLGSLLDEIGVDAVMEHFDLVPRPEDYGVRNEDF